MRQREKEVARRAARLGDPEWKRIAERIDRLAQELDNPDLWMILYAEAHHEERKAQIPIVSRIWQAGYCHAVLLARDIGKITRIIKDWEHEAAQMAEWQSRQNPGNSPIRGNRIPPNFNPPVILLNATSVSIYENLSTTSWLASPIEIETMIDRYVDSIIRQFNAGSNGSVLGNDSLLGLLKGQGNTWLGLLLAKNYPTMMAKRLFKLDAPNLVIGESTEDIDDAFQLNTQDTDISPLIFSKPMEALKTFHNQAIQLLRSEIGPPVEYRVRLPIIQRRLLIWKEDNSKELITLPKNGVFLPKDVISIPKMRADDEAAGGAWARQKTNRNALFRLGNYEVCRLPKITKG